MRIAFCSVSLALLVLTFPASAETARTPAEKKTAQPPAAAQAQTVRTDKARSAPNFDAILTMVDKMFPPQADPDPSRLVLARTSVEAMWPGGAYGKMMTGFIGGIFDRMMQMKESDLAALGNKPKSTAAAENQRTLHDKAAAKDPHFDERMAAMRTILNEEMVKISAVIDPRMREGLARAMARRFDAKQLTDINAFFATQSGHAMASQYMQLWVDPDILRSMMGSLPELMKLMPEMSQKFKAVNDKYPKPAKN